MSISEKLTAIAENEQKVYEAGKQSQYDRFWDIYQNRGFRTDYGRAFCGSGWNDETYKPKYKIAPRQVADYMYAYSNISKLGDMDFSRTVGTFNFTFAYTNLTEIGEITFNSTGTYMLYTFSYSKKLTTVKKLKFNIISEFSNSFVLNESLKNIVFDGIVAGNINFGNSPLLSKDSIKSIVNALSKTTSGKTITFAREAINSAFGIDIDDATTYPEGSEFYTLRNTKANWNFNFQNYK